MKEKAFGYLYLLSLVVLMAACGSTPSYDECGDVEYVKTFPNEYSLAEHKPALSDFEGVVSIKSVVAPRHLKASPTARLSNATT